MDRNRITVQRHPAALVFLDILYIVPPAPALVPRPLVENTPQLDSQRAGDAVHVNVERVAFFQNPSANGDCLLGEKRVNRVDVLDHLENDPGLVVVSDIALIFISHDDLARRRDV